MADDADKSLKIKIESTADNSGLVSAERETEKLTGAVKKSGDAQDDATRIQQKATRETEEHAHKFLGLNTELAEHRRLLGEINSALPGLAEGYGALMNPLTGILGLALTGFIEAKNKLDEFDKELDEKAARMAERYGNLEEAIVEANREIAASAREAADALHGIEKAQIAIQEKTDAATDALKRNETAQLALTDATAAYELAAVEAARKSGKMTDEQAAGAEAKIKHAAEARKNQIEDTEEQAAINQKQIQRDNQDLALHRTNEIVDKLGPDAAHREGEIKNIPNVIEQLGKDLADAKTAVSKQQAKLDRVIDEMQGVRPDERDIFDTTYVQPEREKLSQTEGSRDQIQHSIKSSTDHLEALKGEEKQYQDAKKAAEDAKTAVHNLNIGLQKLRDDAAAAAKLRGQLLNIHDATRNVALPPAAMNQPGGDGVNFPREVQGLVATYRANLAEYNSSNIAGHKQNAYALLEMKRKLDEELATIKSMIDSSKSQIKNLGGNAGQVTPP